MKEKSGIEKGLKNSLKKFMKIVNNKNKNSVFSKARLKFSYICWLENEQENGLL